jgi:hypothetical protein
MINPNLDELIKNINSKLDKITNDHRFLARQFLAGEISCKDYIDLIAKSLEGREIEKLDSKLKTALEIKKSIDSYYSVNGGADHFNDLSIIAIDLLTKDEKGS